MGKYAIVFVVILTIGCVQKGYGNSYLSFTRYKLDNYKVRVTSGKIKVYSNKFFPEKKIDAIVDELGQCLKISIHRDWFVILIPDDWFKSPCYDEQLLPYAADPGLCRKKGLDLPPKCEWVSIPTQQCPCVCNWRVATQWDYIIVTPPNLKLLKPELARMVTGVNNPYTNDVISKCI
jgi:hypothetical protein